MRLIPVPKGGSQIELLLGNSLGQALLANTKKLVRTWCAPAFLCWQPHGGSGRAAERCRVTDLSVGKLAGLNKTAEEHLLGGGQRPQGHLVQVQFPDTVFALRSQVEYIIYGYDADEAMLGSKR